MRTILEADHEALLAAARERDTLLAVINTPELIDFPKAVMLEAQHQEVRWGTSDREGKTPQAWFWLVGHLAGRALEHHKEAERLHRENVECGEGSEVITAINEKHIAHHREKAVHHTITAAAALSHWHASILGKHTTMQPGHGPSIAAAEAMEASNA